MTTTTPKPANVGLDLASRSAVIFRPPDRWHTRNRTRTFISLPERQYSTENDQQILKRSVDLLLKQQDKRGSFNTDEEYCAGDKVDDQLGAASMLAYYLKSNGPDERIESALERAVRFHLDYLVCSSPSRAYRYSRYYQDRDGAGDWCNTQWCIWGGALVLITGTSFLTEKTAADLRDVLADYWSFISTAKYWHDENPCHNQFLAYCDIGILYANATGRTEIIGQVLNHYHTRLRNLRIEDRGHLIYAEYNQWDAHYALLSSTILSHLYAATGDPAFGEDAAQMALNFNERVSAGGYYWGGSRYDECGFDEFIHLISAWAPELGLERLLLPEPSDLWRTVAMDGHWGRGLVMRLNFPLTIPPSARKSEPTPWHFLKGNSSVCLRDDVKLHHFSSCGVEIIPAANILGVGNGVVWSQKGAWKRDPLQCHTPKASKSLAYSISKPITAGEVTGVAAMQRGCYWETRQWWMSNGDSLLWFVHLYNHGLIVSDAINFIIGTPVITRVSGSPVPVTEVANAEGAVVDTQGEAVAISSDQYLKIGDAFIGATAPIEFVRPSADAFHTFPLAHGGSHSDLQSSNELRVQLSCARSVTDCRDSIFFAVEVSKEAPRIISQRDTCLWTAQTALGQFTAVEADGMWSYSLETPSGRHEMPHISFGFRPVESSST